ncbi:tail fiber protein [Flavobacterium ajazii]|uniref:tail fiber protein n=1 Tax=Flavobacterium ajazii TaxID=2692318 RepID=UPI001FE83477|nr:tail fiber protein [Flavobacterium ajazii]
MLTRLTILLFFISTSFINAQIYTPSGTLQGTSTNNNVGIGTNNATTKLTIQAGPDGYATPLKAISILGPNSPANANSAQDLSWDFAAAGSSAIRSYRGSGFDTYLQFMTNTQFGGNAPQVRMHIGGDGNVGIGTSTPEAKLHVKGDLQNNGNILLGHTGEINYISSREVDQVLGIRGSNFIKFATYNGDWKDRMIINNIGNIGIGTTNPNTKLHIIGTQTIEDSTSPAISFTGGASNGTVGAFGDNIRMINFSAFGTTTLQGNGNIDIKTEGGYSIIFGTAAIERMRILSNGNVGIGTSTPEAKLHVKGDLQNNGNILLGHTGETNYISSREVDQVLGIRGSNFIKFSTYNGDWKDRMIINNIGNIGIGTTIPDSKLTVAGNIHSQEVKVTMQAGTVPDYVFTKEYQLKSLDEVEAYIKQNSHLPEIPSAKEIEKNGLMLAEMNMSLLKKIEELTLYSIEQNKKIEAQSKEIETLKDLVLRLAKIENDLAKK